MKTKTKRSLSTGHEHFGFLVEDEFCGTTEIRVMRSSEDLPDEDQIVFQLEVISSIWDDTEWISESIRSFNARPWGARCNPFEALERAKSLAEKLVEQHNTQRA